MSNPGENGWFPECLVCGMGNIGCAVCLDPTCHERRAGIIIAGAREKYLEQAGHCWQLCQFCDRPMLSDGGAFGVYGLCTGCWNAYAQAGRLPPSSPEEVRDHLASGVLRIESVQRGLVRTKEITVQQAQDR